MKVDVGGLAADARYYFEFEALGYRQAIQQIRGEISSEEAVTLTQRYTRRYANRRYYKGDLEGRNQGYGQNCKGR